MLTAVKIIFMIFRNCSWVSKMSITFKKIFIQPTKVSVQFQKQRFVPFKKNVLDMLTKNVHAFKKKGRDISETNYTPM